MFDFDALDEVDPPPALAPDSPFLQRLWAISDPHTDVKENFAFLQRLDAQAHQHDALIVAGDVSDDHTVLRQTFKCLKEKFRWVFFVAGNHDLWVRKQERERTDSLRKLAQLEQLCAEEGVDTKPRRLERADGTGGVWVVPLLSWHCPAFDTEPEIDERWQGLPSAAFACSDYMLCSWPAPLRQEDGSVAAHLDAMNDEMPSTYTPFEQQQVAQLLSSNREAADVVVSFSHFLSRLELLPEKRYLYYPCLAKFVGSPLLGKRVQRLAPDVHVFGHTHFGWDQDIEGIRYISPPMGMPRERSQRMATVTVGNFLEAVEQKDSTPEPVLIWTDGLGFPPRYEAGWSGFYNKYPREPESTTVLPDYVASKYKWDEQKHGPKAEVIGWQGRKPAWWFGPAFCEHRRERVEAEE